MTNGSITRKLLIVDQKQFGYHNITYYMVKYLQNRYDITYFGWHNDLPSIEPGNAKVIQIAKKGILPHRFITFLRRLFAAITTISPDIVFLNYFHGAFLLRLFFPKKLMILDIRSGSVKESLLQRVISDLMIRFDIRFFTNITVISDSLAKRLRLLQKKYFVLPLGAESISTLDKNWNHLELLYVGTLNNRKIEDTVIGFNSFVKKHPDANAVYHIVGAGKKKYIKALTSAITNNQIAEKIFYHGIVPHDQLKPYFDSCNVGVSYIPMNTYFDCQPPTKTIEYLLSGMLVIGTNTSENRNLLSNKYSVLIDDNADSFADGLEKTYLQKGTYTAEEIRIAALAHKWENIIRKLLLYIESQKL